MSYIERIVIRRFKQLEEVILELGNINVLVGANNAGKSSILHAIHFAVSVAQSSKLAGGVNWAAGAYELSISPLQLLYTPVADVMTLSPGGNLRQSRDSGIEIGVHLTDGRVCTVSLRRGRNRNVAITLSGQELGEELQSLESPFSIYAPGLAGIARDERFLSLGLIRRIVARGDANLALRNVLYQLSKTDVLWSQFHEDMRRVFPSLEMTVEFDHDSDEHIRAYFSPEEGLKLPLEAAGTSVLQAAQIVGYVNLFSPRLLILDEPDSHLHANNQRSLCGLIQSLAQDRNFQVLLCTHSRHVVDALRNDCTLLWINDGQLVPVEDLELTSLLLDLGALDSIDYFADGQLRCVVATEDTNTAALELLLWASGFHEDETEVVSYSGCSNVEAAIVLGRFLGEKAANVRLVVHRDNDYLPADAVQAYGARLTPFGITPFVTDSSDVEGYFLSPQHLAALNPGLSEDRIAELLTQAQLDTRDRSIEKITNLRVEHEFRRRRQAHEQGSPNVGQIAVEAHQAYDANPSALCRGKITLKCLSSLMQAELGSNPVVDQHSPQLAVPQLQTLAAEIWGGNGE